ncbi:MAG: hypothetical protein R3B92_00550 [Patescibacteria group bacterium]|uniref:Prepilin-type N-terminal cleavage/methylation domain-containing protein n=1 Tax=candidate division WWE3 bacterium TaxID=2053526 RepID=A0A955EB14_UNCKA|nr:hypothetical protein [candidate division WWE3 bacterium]
MRNKVLTTKLNNKGVTIVEMLIYLGLLSILLVVFTELLVSTLDLRQEVDTVSSLEQDTAFIVSRISYDLKRADAITFPANGGNLGNRLTLTIGGTTYQYDLSGTNLQLADATGTHNVNGNQTQISNLNILRLGNSAAHDAIQLSFTLTTVGQVRGEQRQIDISTTIGTR